MRAAFPILAIAMALAACATVPNTERAAVPSVDFYSGLDSEARLIASSALQDALEAVPSGQSHFWSAPNGAGGSVTPLRTVREASGRFCRDFNEMLIRPRQNQETRRSRACRDGDAGLWRPA